ncbi:MAG: class I SAM-dependent methyltransferase, partial [Thermoleophilaceae bacterium]
MIDAPVQLYDATYQRFELDARRSVRLETYGEDFGQNGWLTAGEWRAALDRLELTSDSRVLDVACG